MGRQKTHIAEAVQLNQPVKSFVPPTVTCVGAHEGTQRMALSKEARGTIVAYLGNSAKASATPTPAEPPL